jgi:BolA family transcriptional regulator, general stress-responsive regulator
MSELNTVQQAIETKLNQQLQPQYLLVENESHMHAVPPNSETHFKVTIVASQFEQLRLVKRHQLVYQVLTDELAGPVHALALHTLTPGQWQQKSQNTPQSPNCMGGGK